MRNADFICTRLSRGVDSERTQVSFGLFAEGVRELTLPAPDEDVLPGLRWGEPAEIFSPAFWAHQVWLFDLGGAPSYRLGDTLIEEVAACLLGGFGFRSEVGLAAFNALRGAGLLVPGSTQDRIERVLRMPLNVHGHAVRYRFPRQKAIYLANFLDAVRETPPPSCGGVALRDWLVRFKGIGMKTASWAVHNWLNSDDVAVIDIHIYRAGLLTGFFEPDFTVGRHYAELEQRFIAFSRAIKVPASDLDAVMWEQMREFGDYPLKMLKSAGLGAEGLRQ